MLTGAATLTVTNGFATFSGLAITLGTGNGYSVLQVVKAFEKASGKKVNYKITDRRPGDIAECYADPTKAAKELHWKAKYGIDEMCADAWNFAKKNWEN